MLDIACLDIECFDSSALMPDQRPSTPATFPFNIIFEQNRLNLFFKKIIQKMLKRRKSS